MVHFFTGILCFWLQTELPIHCNIFPLLSEQFCSWSSFYETVYYLDQHLRKCWHLFPPRWRFSELYIYQQLIYELSTLLWIDHFQCCPLLQVLKRMFFRVFTINYFIVMGTFVNASLYIIKGSEMTAWSFINNSLRIQI